MGEWIQGKYTLKNPEKYLGDPSNIIYRSSWELDVFSKLDHNPNIIKWVSEEIAIPYAKPDIKSGGFVQGMYYPDIFIVKKNINGKIERELLEIKPHKQTEPPKSKKPARRLQEQYTYMVNRHKWAAAEEWCKKRGITFRLLTEKNLFV